MVLGPERRSRLISEEEKRLIGMNAAGISGAEMTREELLRRGYDQVPGEGAESITVPGALAGWAAPTFSALLVTRMVSGVVAAGIFTIGMAIVGDLLPVGKRQVAMGRLLFAGMSGNILGATFAGIIADLTGWRDVFLALAAISGICIAVLVLALRDAIKDVPQRFQLSVQVENFRTIFSHPLAKVCFGAVFLEGTFLFGLFPHMAALLYEGGETRASIAGIVLAGFGSDCQN